MMTVVMPTTVWVSLHLPRVTLAGVLFCVAAVEGVPMWGL